jgi:hypothetical protein
MVGFNLFGLIKRRLRRKLKNLNHRYGSRGFVRRALRRRAQQAHAGACWFVKQTQINTDVVAHNICVHLWFQQKSIDTLWLDARFLISKAVYWQAHSAIIVSKYLPILVFQFIKR